MNTSTGLHGYKAHQVPDDIDEGGVALADWELADQLGSAAVDTGFTIAWGCLILIGCWLAPLLTGPTGVDPGDEPALVEKGG